MTSSDVFPNCPDPFLSLLLVQMFIRDAGNPLQREFLKEFNRVKDNFKLMIKVFCTEKYLLAKFTWVSVEYVIETDDNNVEIGRTNMLYDFLKDIKERV